MKTIRAWWAKLGPRQKFLYATAGVVLGALIIAAIIGFIIQSQTDDEAETAPSPSPSDSQTDADEDEETVEVGDYEFVIDSNGMVEMPVTDDPREAAAGAAAVAFSVELAKMDRDEFVDEAIARMTHPSDDYIGPEGEVHTWVETPPFEDPIREYLAPEDALHRTVDRASEVTQTEYFHWWTLVNSNIYNDLAVMPDLAWKGQPKEVLNREEMQELSPVTVGKTNDSTVDREPDTEGAQWDNWYVLSEVEGAEVGSAYPQYEYPAAFAIWCDAPDDGGLCGVGSLRDPQFPDSWQRR